MASALSDYHAIVRLLMRSVYDTRYDTVSMEKALDRIYEILARDPSALPFPFVFSPEPERPPTPPSLVIHSDQGSEEIVPSAIVMVTKEEPEVRNLVVNVPSTLALPPKPSVTDAAILKALRKDDEEEDGDDDSASSPEVESDDEEESGLVSTGTPADSESDSESEDEEEEETVEEEVEEEDEEEEEEEEVEEEDEDLALRTIKGEKYYWSPSSKRVYECLEEGYGDCIGTFENGKLNRK